eukprot:5483735-Alexandrium_andersonii.AAC.1
MPAMIAPAPAATRPARAAASGCGCPRWWRGVLHGHRSASAFGRDLHFRGLPGPRALHFGLHCMYRARSYLRP